MPILKPTLHPAQGQTRTFRTTLYECMIEGADPHEAIVETTTPYLFLLPSNIDLVGADIELVNMPNRELVLRM